MLLASTDISAVPADFVKYFFIMFAFVAGLYFAHRKGKQASGTRDEPVNIEQPLEIKKTPVYARKEEVERMQKEISRVMQAGDERRVEIINAIHGSERRMIDEVKDLHERLNPVAEGFKGHAALLDQIDKRLSASELARRDENARMQQRIDDAIRASSSKYKS